MSEPLLATRPLTVAVPVPATGTENTWNWSRNEPWNPVISPVIVNDVSNENSPLAGAIGGATNGAAVNVIWPLKKVLGKTVPSTICVDGGNPNLVIGKNQLTLTTSPGLKTQQTTPEMPSTPRNDEPLPLTVKPGRSLPDD